MQRLPVLAACSVTLLLAVVALLGAGIQGIQASTPPPPPTPAVKVHLPVVARAPAERTGWAIGSDASKTAVILHTTDSGAHWSVQGDRSLWLGREGEDISAVDARTAWAALSESESDPLGAILHTTDGGQTWYTQTLPAGVTGQIKGIKGVSRQEAWAVTLRGTILHTVDGGATWTVVPHPGISIAQVNRIDALGQDVWIADYQGGENGVTHSPDAGLSWRQETLPGVEQGNGPLAINALSSTVVWAAVNAQTQFFRTLDGGGAWESAYDAGGRDQDLDDLCAGSEDLAWGVLNLSGRSGGLIYRVDAGSDATAQQFDPLPGYMYEGITCLDGSTAWVAGYRGDTIDPGQPQAIILHTEDAGASWESQPLAADDFDLWKISFVGARR